MGNNPKYARPAPTERKPFPAPGAWFGVDVLGNPIREYQPGKWEGAVWPSERKGEPIGYLPQWAVDRLTGKMGAIADPVTWGLHAPIMSGSCPHTVAIYTSPQVPEVLPWKGLNLHSMAEAFEQVIEAAAHRENPFVNPVTKQAQLALREFRLCIPAMEAIAAARKGK